MPTSKRRWPETAMAYDPISVRVVEALPIAAVRRQVTAKTLMAEAMKAPIWTLTQQRGLKSTGQLVLIYHDRDGEMLINRPGGVAVDIGVQVETPFQGDAALQCVMTPAGRVAWARHHGHYELLPTIHGDIRAWCISQGLQIAGINWEHYWHWHEEPERRSTDVFYLLRDQT
jgi:effector-binding domain-containing protein